MALLQSREPVGESVAELDQIAHDGGQRPDVLFLADVAALLRISARTIRKRLRAGTFPIPELPRLDTKRRWSRAVVLAWIHERQHAPARIVGRRLVNR